MLGDLPPPPLHLEDRMDVGLLVPPLQNKPVWAASGKRQHLDHERDSLGFALVGCCSLVSASR